MRESGPPHTSHMHRHLVITPFRKWRIVFIVASSSTPATRMCSYRSKSGRSDHQLAVTGRSADGSSPPPSLPATSQAQSPPLSHRRRSFFRIASPHRRRCCCRFRAIYRQTCWKRRTGREYYHAAARRICHCRCPRTRQSYRRRNLLAPPCSVAKSRRSCGTSTCTRALVGTGHVAGGTEEVGHMVRLCDHFRVLVAARHDG